MGLTTEQALTCIGSGLILGAFIMGWAVIISRRHIDSHVSVPNTMPDIGLLPFKEIIGRLTKDTPGARDKFITMFIDSVPEQEVLHYISKFSKKAWNIENQTMMNDKLSKRPAQNSPITGSIVNNKGIRFPNDRL